MLIHLDWWIGFASGPLSLGVTGHPAQRLAGGPQRKMTTTDSIAKVRPGSQALTLS